MAHSGIPIRNEKLKAEDIKASVNHALAPLSGLSASEAQTRLTAEGFNELARGGQRTPLRIVLEVLREPMFALSVGWRLNLPSSG